MVPLTLLLTEELTAVPKKERSGLVARRRDGKPWKEFGLGQAFRRACMKAKLNRTWRFHDLRHFFVTGLFRVGVPANVAQALAGHRDLATTQRYAHATNDDLVAAIALLGKRTG
jgi:integrase